MKFIITLLLFAITIQLQAQLTREQAVNLVIEEIVYPDSLQSTHLYSRYEMMYEGDTLWQEGQFDYQLVPYDDCWVLFIDDAPIAYWAHPCRYVFLDASNGEIEVVEDDWPPDPFFSVGFFDAWEWILETGLFEANLPAVDVYPNPFNEVIHVTIGGPVKGETRLLLKDHLGRCLLETSIINAIKTSTLAEGWYLMQIYMGGTLVCQRKLIKSLR